MVSWSISTRVRLAGMVVLAGCVFCLFVGQGRIVTSHEARVVLTAKAMADSGWPWNARAVEVPTPVGSKVDGVTQVGARGDGSTISVNPWLIPIFEEGIRLQKPPLPYWSVAVLFRLLGESETAARLPSALAGVVSTLLLWDLTRRLLGRRTAMLSVIVWVSGYFVITEFRKSMADPYLALMALAAAWAWAAGSWKRSEGMLNVKGRRGVGGGEKEVGRPKTEDGIQNPELGCLGVGESGSGSDCETASDGREVSGSLIADRSSLIHDSSLISDPSSPIVDSPSLSVSSPATGNWQLATLLFYLFLAMGALAKGPVIFLHVGLFVAAHAICFRALPRGRWWVHLMGVALFAAIVLPWPWYVVGHVPGAVELWRYESVGEFSDNLRNPRPWFFYLLQLPLLTLPWTAWWIGGVGLNLVRRRRHQLLPLLWVVGGVVIFSFAHMKKPSYLLPLAPAMAMLTAQGLKNTLVFARLRRSGQVRLLAGVHAVIGVGFAIAIIAMLIAQQREGLGHGWWAVGLAGLVLIPLSILPFFIPTPGRFYRWVAVQGMVYGLLILTLQSWPDAVDNNRRPPVALVPAGVSR